MAQTLTPEEQQRIEAQAKADATRDFLAKKPSDPSMAERAYTGFIKPAVLPTGLSYAGGVVGGAAGTVLGNPALGAMAGSSIGSGLGEAANQALGISEPSLSSIGTAMAVPSALYGLGQLGHAIFKMGPKHGAQALNAMADDEAMVRLGKYGSPDSLKQYARTLFSGASALGGKIPAEKTLATIDDWIPRLQMGSSETAKINAPIVKRLQSLSAKIRSTGQAISPDDLQAELHNFDELIGTIKKRGGSGLGAYQAVRGQLAAELDDTASAATSALQSGAPIPYGGEAASKLVQARDAWKRGTLLSDMQENIQRAVKSLRGQGGDTQFNAAEVIRWMGKDKFFKQVFSATEQDEIKGIFTLLNKLPALQPPSSVNVGGKRALQMLASGAGGAAAASQAGVGGIGTVLAGVAGLALPPLAETAHNLAIAMQMQTGRALVRQLLTETKGVWTPQAAAILGAYTHAVVQQPGTEMTQ